MQNDSNGNDANDGQFRRRNTCAFHECRANDRIAQLCTKHFANEGRKKTNIGYVLICCIAFEITLYSVLNFKVLKSITGFPKL